MAARRYVLIRGLFHLCLVSTTWLAMGPGSSEFPHIGVCKEIGWSLEEGRVAISITVVLVAMSTLSRDAAVHLEARTRVWILRRIEWAQHSRDFCTPLWEGNENSAWKGDFMWQLQYPDS